MIISIDLGGSTVDVLEMSPPDKGDRGGFESKSFHILASLESSEIDKNNLEEILKKSGMSEITQDFSPGIEKIILTGGHSRHFEDSFQGIPIEVIPEIDAIGAGGLFLSGEKEALVCSLGTGTCCVSAREGEYTHIGGTGVGGGTLLGLARTILQKNNFASVAELVEKGNSKNIDLTVSEIVGGAIGIIPGSATASNFAKANSQKNSEDLARGIANLVGQTIASIAVFAAQSTDHKHIILGGKLTRLPHICEVIKKTAAIYHREVIVPEDASVMSAVGAGVLATKEDC